MGFRKLSELLLFPIFTVASHTPSPCHPGVNPDHWGVLSSGSTWVARDVFSGCEDLSNTYKKKLIMSSTPTGSLVPNLSSEVPSSISGTSSIVSTPSVSSLVGEGGASDGNQNCTAVGGGNGGGGPPVIQDSTTILLIVLFVFLAFFVYLVGLLYSLRAIDCFITSACMFTK